MGKNIIGEAHIREIGWQGDICGLFGWVNKPNAL
jgi:hypothetical protein